MQIQGEFINDAAEAAGVVVFLCYRADIVREVEAREMVEYRAVANLGLTGTATTTGSARTTEVEHPLLIRGIHSTSTGATIRIIDSVMNMPWSTVPLPVSAYAGILGNPSPIIYYPLPYYLPARGSLVVEWINTGAETGKFIEFVAERILR
jgi:hypothetical protein